MLIRRLLETGIAGRLLTVAVTGSLLLACDDSDTPTPATPDAAGVTRDAGVDAAVPPAADAGADASGAGGADASPDAGGGTTFRVRITNVAPFTMLKSGVFDTKVGGTAPGPIAPGEAYEFKLTAGKGHKLAFATMFGQSNDWVFATPPGGIDLYDVAGTPVSGDVTSQIALYDVGTEIDEEPAVGPHTGPNQATSTDGPGANDPNNLVRKLGATVALSSGTAFQVPAIAAMIKVSITPTPATREFTVRIQNASQDGVTLQTSQGAKPVRQSPGVWALAAGTEPLFSVGVVDRGQGLEQIAEEGNPMRLGTTIKPLSGLATGLSPGVFVVSRKPAPLFTLGQPDRAQGLERIAEEGNIMQLAASLAAALPDGATATGTFAIPVGAAAPGPIGSGGAYEFDVRAVPGEALSFVTMYGWSNDWVFGTPEAGLPLFDATGAPAQGNVTAQIHLYDVGTELSEEPAVGPNTGPQQPAPNTGPVDSDPKVREVTPTVYATPVTSHVSVTITPQP